MTRYLMERPPDLDRGRSDIMDLSRKTKKERKALILRQSVLKHTIELAFARCLRPDLIRQALLSLVSTIYDFSYGTFEGAVLASFIDPMGTIMLRAKRSGGGVGNA